MHGIPKALPNDYVAQGRLISYILLALLVGDVRLSATGRNFYLY